MFLMKVCESIDELMNINLQNTFLNQYVSPAKRLKKDYNTFNCLVNCHHGMPLFCNLALACSPLFVFTHRVLTQLNVLEMDRSNSLMIVVHS